MSINHNEARRHAAVIVEVGPWREEIDEGPSSLDRGILEGEHRNAYVLPGDGARNRLD